MFDLLYEKSENTFKTSVLQMNGFCKVTSGSHGCRAAWKSFPKSKQRKRKQLYFSHTLATSSPSRCGKVSYTIERYWPLQRRRRHLHDQRSVFERSPCGQPFVLLAVEVTHSRYRRNTLEWASECDSCTYSTTRPTKVCSQHHQGTIRWSHRLQH